MTYLIRIVKSGITITHNAIKYMPLLDVIKVMSKNETFRENTDISVTTSGQWYLRISEINTQVPI